MRGTFILALLLIAANAAAADKVTLKALDRNPDRYLGQTVTIEGILAKDITAAGSKAILDVSIGRNEKLTSVQFVAATSLADQLREAIKAESRKVRIVGTVMAPTAANAPYDVEIEEISLLGDYGVVTASYKPVVSPVEKPPAVPSTPPAPAPEPTNEPASELPLGTLLAVGLALLAGCGLVIFFLIKRASAAKARAALSVRSVSERLERRAR